MGGSEGPTTKPDKRIRFFAIVPGPGPNDSKSWFGHAFVQFEDDPAYGFYPTGLRVDSPSRANLSLCYKVSYKNWGRARDVLGSYFSKTYLVDGVCHDVCKHVAQAAGLSIPGKYLGPAEWLGEMAIKSPSNC